MSGTARRPGRAWRPLLRALLTWRLLATLGMAVAAGSAVWLVVPPLVRRIITGDTGAGVVITDHRTGLWLWYPTAGSQALSEAEVLAMWVAAAGAALLAALTTVRCLRGGRR